MLFMTRVKSQILSNIRLHPHPIIRKKSLNQQSQSERKEKERSNFSPKTHRYEYYNNEITNGTHLASSHPSTNTDTTTCVQYTHTLYNIFFLSLSSSNSLSLSLSFSLYLSTSQEVYKTYLSCTYVRVCECESL